MTCRLRPVEYNVVIRPKSSEKTTPGGIILLDKTVDADKLATDEGEIVAVSSLAFNYDDYADDERPQVGDQVKYSRYAGVTVLDDKGEIEFRIVKDKDIWAVVQPMGEVVPIRPAIDLSDHISLPPVNLAQFQIHRPVPAEIGDDCA